MLKHAKIYTPGQTWDTGSLVIDDRGEIGYIGVDSPVYDDQVDIIDAHGKVILPGLVDVHIHGGNGCKVMDGCYRSINEISRFHAAHGTTSFLATTETDSDEKLSQALTCAVHAMKQGVDGAEVLGIHLEGPFIDKKMRGAQDLAHIRLPSTAELERYHHLADGHIKLVTLAPEIEGGLEAVKWYREHGVTVSVGHSNATFEQVVNAMKAGATHTTHHFNGMSALHHREPGVAGAGMILPELTTELIADGFHVHPEMIRFLFKAKGASNVCLITDAVECCGLPDGRYGQRVMKDGRVMLVGGSASAEGPLADGTLAGSTLTSLQGLKNAVAFTGLSIVEVLTSFTEVPARQIGASNKGTLQVGKDADFLVLDQGLNLLQTFVKGEMVYSALTPLDVWVGFS